jgi:hypothetical protein
MTDPAVDRRMRVRDELYALVERRDNLVLEALAAGVLEQEVANIVDVPLATIRAIAERTDD